MRGNTCFPYETRLFKCKCNNIFFLRVSIRLSFVSSCHGLIFPLSVLPTFCCSVFVLLICLHVPFDLTTFARCSMSALSFLLIIGTSSESIVPGPSSRHREELNRTHTRQFMMRINIIYSFIPITPRVAENAYLTKNNSRIFKS